MVWQGFSRLPHSFTARLVSRRGVRFLHHDTNRGVIATMPSLGLGPAPFSISIAKRSFSTEMSSRLCENNSQDQQPSAPPAPQEWTNFEGKLPILKEHDNNPSLGVLGMYGDAPRTSVLMELTDRVGILHDVLRYFWKCK